MKKNKSKSKGPQPKAKKQEQNKENELTEEQKYEVVREEGIFDAFEFVLKSYYNGGMNKDVNIFDFAIHRIPAFLSQHKAEKKLQERKQKYSSLPLAKKEDL